MQIELRTQVIEPERKTFTNLAKRFGDRPASRYEEGSIDVQSVANFHYRPLRSSSPTRTPSPTRASSTTRPTSSRARR